ncbi:MAG: leucyl aminopeptidase [Pseudomonadota bacterium]
MDHDRLPAVSFVSPNQPLTRARVIALPSKKKLAPKLRDWDAQGAISRALEKDPSFTGAYKQVLTLAHPSQDKIARIVLFGSSKNPKPLAIEQLGGRLARTFLWPAEKKETDEQNSAKAGMKKTDTAKTGPVVGIDLRGVTQNNPFAAHLAFGILLGLYRFDRYRTTPAKNLPPSKIILRVDRPAVAQKAFDRLRAVALGVYHARDLVSEPSNILYPDSFARRISQLSKLGLKVEVLDEKRLKKEGFGALLAVGQGSARPPRLVVMQWKGGGKKPPVAFVGKGVTFDTGGISIKPSANMWLMRFDMGGAAAVVGAMEALARRKAKANVVGVVALAENMPSGKAMLPGDIITSLAGKTIETLNTDAEGRLILADALHYTITRFSPSYTIDLATLTGAMIVALADVRAGLFANDSGLEKRLREAGEATGDRLWPFPMDAEYHDMVKGTRGDLRNIAPGHGAGSIVGATFLAAFVGMTKWAHLDIAGMCEADKDKDLTPKGATGFGVRLLDRLIA